MVEPHDYHLNACARRVFRGPGRIVAFVCVIRPNLTEQLRVDVSSALDLTESSSLCVCSGPGRSSRAGDLLERLLPSDRGRGLNPEP